MSVGAGAGAGAGARGRAPLLPLPAEASLVDYVLQELKSQGIFDQFRKECISDVDTKPAYQNLRQRVEGTVAGFLNLQTWSPDLNKNQLREKLRKHIFDSNYLDQGVERIVDQVVNPKITSVFIPHVEEIVSKCLGLEKPSETDKPANGDNYTPTKNPPNSDELLPNDLESVSPESVKSHCNKSGEIALENIKTPPPRIPTAVKIETSAEEAKLELEKFKLNVDSEDSENSNEEEFESPAFEPLEINFPTKEESQLSGASDDYKVNVDKEVKSEKEVTNSDIHTQNSNSQLSEVSSDSNFSNEGTDTKTIKLKTNFKNTIDSEKEYDSNNFCEQMEVVEVSHTSTYKFNENSSDARQYGFEESVDTSVHIGSIIRSVSTTNDTSTEEVFFREKVDIKPENSAEVSAFENIYKDSDKSKRSLDSPKMVCTTEMMVDSNESNGAFDQNKAECESTKNPLTFENKILSCDKNVDGNDSSNSSSLKIDLSKENVPKSDIEDVIGIIKSPTEENKSKDDDPKRSHRDRKDSSNYKSSKESDRHSHNSKDRDRKDDSRHHSKSSHSRHSSSGRRDSDRRHSSSHDRRDSYSSKSDKPTSKDSHSETKDRHSKDKYGKYGTNGDSRKDSKDKHSSSHKSSSSYKSSKHSDSKYDEKSSRSSEKHSSLSRHDSRDSDRHRDSNKSNTKSDSTNKESRSNERKSSYSSSKDRSSSKHSSDRNSKLSSEMKDDKKSKKTPKDDYCSTAGKSRKNRRSSDRDSNDGNGSSARGSNAGGYNTSIIHSSNKKSSGSSGDNSSNGNCSSGQSDSVNTDHVNITKGSYIKSEFNMFQFGSMNAMKRQSTSEKSPPLKSPEMASKKIENSIRFSKDSLKSPRDPSESPRDILMSPRDILMSPRDTPKSPKVEESLSEKSMLIKSPEIPSKKPIHIDSQLNPVRIEETLLCERTSLSLVKKPKCASNIFEARKIMKVRKMMDKIERKKKQEAILIMEKQQNIPMNSSQVYSGLSGPELKIPCVKEDDVKAPLINGHVKSHDRKEIPQDFNFFDVKDDEKLSRKIEYLEKVIGRLQRECAKDTNTKDKCETTTAVHTNGFREKNAATVPYMDKILNVKMIDLYKNNYKNAMNHKCLNPRVEIETMPQKIQNPTDVNSVHGAIADSISTCDFNSLKEEYENSSDRDLTSKDIMEIILGDLDFNNTMVYFKHTPLTTIKLTSEDDTPVKLCNKKPIGLKRKRTSASTSSGSDNCFENVNHNNNVKDQPQGVKRKITRRSLATIGAMEASEIPGSPDSDKSIENHVNKNVDNTVKTVFKNHKKTNCISDELKTVGFSVLNKDVKISALSKCGKGRLYKAKYLQSRTTPRKLAVVDKAM